MREQKQKIEISLLDLRKFVGVDRFLIIDTVFGNKNTYNSKTTASYPGLNYFSPAPVQGVQMVGSIVFPSLFFRPHTTTWTPWKGYFSAFLYYKTTRLLSPVNRLSVWGKSETLSLPSPRDFFTLFPNREPVHKLRLLGQVTLKLTSFPVPPLFLSDKGCLHVGYCQFFSFIKNLTQFIISGLIFLILISVSKIKLVRVTKYNFCCIKHGRELKGVCPKHSLQGSVKDSSAIFP